MARAEAKYLSELLQTALMRVGVPADHASLQADLLLEAELRGVPSHGTLRVSRIVSRIRNGIANPKATGIHEWVAEAFLSVDGEQGLGPVVGQSALDALQKRAARTGIAAAAVRNSNHIGMLAWYAERVATQGFSIIALSTSEALVHPWGARQAMIGTNPVAIGVPTEGGNPFVMDTATSLVSMVRVPVDRDH